MHASKELKRTFRWRDREGNFHKPALMETRHLFYTVRMIWNHTMPKPARIEPYKKYKFSELYNEEYMRNAVRVMVPELARRRDLAPQWKEQLKHMINWLATGQLDNPKQAQEKLKEDT